MTKRHDFSLFLPSEAGAGGADARRFVRQARFAALATIDTQEGAPFASLVSLATDADGQPLLLLSNLARHTRNVLREPRASLLIHEAAAAGDPLTAMRVTLKGRVAKSEDQAAMDRFLAWQPEASGYAAFADFNLYRFAVDAVHVVAGFGRIKSFDGKAYLADAAFACAGLKEALQRIDAEPQRLLASVWVQQADGRAPEEPVKLKACDSDGVVLQSGASVHRITFASQITSAEHLAEALAACQGRLS